MSKGHFILYNSNEKNFTSMGVLVLDNYISNTCIKETMNENYTFEFEMCNDVAHLVGHRMYIKAPTRKGEELFRVRIIEKDMNNYGATYFYCTQVFFCDMEDNFIENLELLNVTGYAALNSMDTNTQYPHNFTFYSDISEENSTIIFRKNFVSALIGDSEYSFVNTWGGELEVNKFSVKMMSKIGQDRGVRIRYRKNLTGLNAKTDYSSYCTRIMPIGYDDITIPEKYVDSEKIDLNHPIIRVVEFSNIKVKSNEEDEEGYDTIEEAENALREAAQLLFTEGKIDEPESTYEIEFQELSSTIEYRDDYAILENIFLGDTVEVYHESLDVSVSTRCVSYEYDPKTDRYISITLGNVISKFSSSSIKNQETILDKIESNEKDYQGKLDDAVEKLTNMINTGLTGHVVITDNEIMIMDTTDKDTAVEVWRYNINGFGYSNTGYNGPFIGLTKDGKLLVTEATTNKFTAALINAGILQSVDRTSWFNLDSGTFSWANGAIAYDGTDLTIKIGDQNINDLLDTTFNVLVNHEHQIIQLDSNYFPVNNGSYEFTFTVLKENSTVETPCLVTGVTPNVAVDGISFKMKDNKCTMVVDKTKRLLNVKESFFDVTLEVLDYTLTKRLTWSVSVNGRDGEDGVNGTPGINGKDGTNSYFHIRYSDVPNPTSSSQMTETPSYYIGVYTDSIQTDSDDPTKYTWSRFRGIDGNNGKDGLPGIDGKDGTTYYYHVKYSDDGRTFTADDGETPGKYLGLLIDTTKGDSLIFNAYTWKKIEGDAGANASYVRISNNGQVFLKGKAATSFKPTSITLTPIFTNATYSNWQYSVDNTSTWNTVTSGQNGLTISGNNLIVASTSALFTSTVKSILFKVNCTNGASDTITLVRIEEGKDGKGVKSITNYYLASSSSSDVTTSTSGWTTTVQSISTSEKYLWNYEVIEYTDRTSITTSPTIIGVHGTNGTNGQNGADGDDGKGISTITEYYLATSASSDVTTSTSGWTTTVQSMTSTKRYLWNYEVIKYTDNSKTTGSPKIIGVYGDKGASAINILLSNESHTFAASSNGAAVAANITTNVLCYKGSTLTACKVGTISGLPTGMTATINDNSTTGPSITIAVTTSLTTKAGTITIPVTCGSVTVNKIFSYSLAVAGANGTNGTNGTNAKLIKINASTNVFKSTDGGVTFAPSSISLTPTVQNVSFSKWQYSSNGSSFTNVTSGEHGLTVNGSTLVVSATSDLFTDTVTTLAIRVVSSTSTVYDTMTLYKLYDRTDINDKFEEMTLTVTQSNEKWEAAFKNSNANNMFLNSDFMTGTADDWIDNGGGISIGTASAFPFYGNTEYYLRTSFPRGVRYAHDIQLEPDTDYVYEGYIYVNASLTGTNATPLNFWIWTGDTPTSTRLATIVDYRQTMTSGRFVKCYVHFKTNNVTEALYGRFFVYHTGTASRAGVKRMSLKKGTVESTWTQHPNEVKSIVTSIDKDGVKVKHSEAGTYTQMDSTGFSIRDSATDDVFAWLSSKEQWTELKVDKVFANNLENIYEGSSNLYVDHSAKVAGDGSVDKPFNSFNQLSNHLMATPVINKDIYIVVRDPGFVINEPLYLERLKGTGFIKITLEGTLVIANPGNGQYCIRLHQISKWVWIVGSREFGSSTTGAMLQDGGDGNGHGIYTTDVDRLEIDALTIACKNWGIHSERTYLYTWHVDFGKCYCAVELRYQSIYYSSDDVGSCVDFVRLNSGSFAYWGCGTVRPQGDVKRWNGMLYDGGTLLTPTASPRYSSSNPTPPASSGQTFTYTYNWTSHKTYAYSWSNWNDSDCKQGSWGYGLRGGHMFFDISTLRSQMTGTVQDGNTITLTRASSGGESGGANVYINGSTCSSASGTPSYGGQTHLGTLAWGETKTFTLPKAIVQGLVSGNYNSLAVYVNSTASDCYLKIVNASITLKTKK